MTGVAYLTSRYPAISHTFVRREVDALRDLGVAIDTYSVRRVGPDQLLAEEERRAFATTTALVPPRIGSLLRAALAAVAHPSRLVGLVRFAASRGGRNPKRVVWQLFYVVEALLLWSACRRRGTTHIHAHFANVAADVARLAARFGGDGWTWSFTMHGPTELSNVDRFGLADKVIDADFVVCISDFCRSQLFALVDEEHWPKLHVVHCGIVPELLPLPDRDEHDGLRVLCVGRLVPEKGQAVLLDALVLLRDRGFDVEATFVGDGPRRAALERRAAADSLDVTFAGAVAPEHVAAHYRRTDVFCLPSFAEGVPVVLMEAMASGLPVVTTRIAGISELVDDAAGIVVAPGRADLLADAIGRLAGDGGLRRKMGESGRAVVMEAFDVRQSAARLRQLFGTAT